MGASKANSGGIVAPATPPSRAAVPLTLGKAERFSGSRNRTQSQTRMAGGRINKMIEAGAGQRTTSVPEGTDQNGADYMSKLTPDQLAAKVASDHNRAAEWKKGGADFVTKINATRAEDYRPPQLASRI